jgi:hypothetical protein
VVVVVLLVPHEGQEFDVKVIMITVTPEKVPLIYEKAMETEKLKNVPVHRKVKASTIALQYSQLLG